MNKNRIAYLLIFLVIYVLWLIKGEDVLGIFPEPDGSVEDAHITDGGSGRDGVMHVAWLTFY